MAHEKIGKQAVLYLHKPNTEYQCRDCAMFLAETERCTIHGPDDIIKAYGSCGLFVKGKAMTGKPMSEVTKLDSGYGENEAGFSCKRCANFQPRSQNCRVVDPMSEGPDFGWIDADACCNAWQGK